MADAKKRSLLELRVIDLKCELEKRGLDKGGVRAVLLKRLTKAVKDEGHNPDTFTVDISGNDQKSPIKRVSRSDSAVENDEPPMDVSVDELLVQDEINDEDESAEKMEEETEAEAKPEEEATGNDIKVNRKRENDEKVETPASKKPCVEKTPAQERVKKQAEQSNTDAEDSINLDIGDDELLNDEADSTSRAKKDEGATPQQPQEEPPATDGDATQADADAEPLSDRHDDDTPAVAKKTSEADETEKDKDKKGDKEDNGTSDSKNAECNAGLNVISSSSSGQARNLWVSGLSGDTRAKDLKQLCSKHGKVIGAKVVTNARTPGSRCYGYVTMASAQDAENCIKNLHRTELHGRMISVEKAKSESSASATSSGVPRDSSSSTWRSSAAARRDGAPRRSASGGGAGDGKESKESKEENGTGKEAGAEQTGEEVAETGDKEKGETEGAVEGATRDGDERKADDKGKHSSDRASRPGDRHADKTRRERSRGRRNSPRDVLSFSKIWKERDSARSRERVRAVREEERRRRAADEDLRERERRQRNEKHRLGLEREKLRQEREKIEREKNELLRLERERHKLEREKLELERLELKRAQIRLEEERSRGLKRSYEPTYDRNARPERKAVSPPTYDRHKRSVPSAATAVSTGNSRQFEPPPPPRFELPTPAYERAPADKRERDYKRDYTRHISSSANVKYPSNGTASDDSRQPLPPGTRPKEQSRYVDSERSGVRGEGARTSAGREGRSYRGASPGKGDSARNWGAAAPRYADAPAQSKGEYSERSSWHSNSKYSSSRHPPPSSAPPVSTHQTWGKPGGESWASGSGGETRYGGGGATTGATYESRYAAPYQPPPPGAAPYVADTRYAPPASAREYRKY